MSAVPAGHGIGKHAQSQSAEMIQSWNSNTIISRLEQRLWSGEMPVTFSTLCLRLLPLPALTEPRYGMANTHTHSVTLVGRHLVWIAQQTAPAIISGDVPSCPAAQISIDNLQPETKADPAGTYTDEMKAFVSLALR